MIVQFFSYGDGLSKGPLDYLLGKDRAREHARILSGSEAEIAGLIDTSPYHRKYTSGCLSFYESDLSDEAKSKVMADFEKCLFPGLDQGQYRVLWIEHRDKVNDATGQQRLELNFLIPNVEVFSGKSLQPFYHKADMSRVDLFKKVTNYENHFYDPDDPINRQPTTIQKNLPKAVKEIKATVNRLAETAVEQGDIYDRESLKKWLIGMGFEITNEKPNSLSIKNPYGDDDSRPIRLTGAIYEQDYRVRAEGTSLSSEASSRYREESRGRYEADLQRYQDHLAKKAEYHQRKYRTGGSEPEGAGQPSYGRDHDPNLGKQGLLETAAERSHSRDLRADQDLQRAATERAYAGTERAYAGTERVSHSTQEAGRELTSELERVELLARRASTGSEFEKSPFQIDLSPDFSSLYFSYMQHRRRVLPKKPKRSHSPNEQPGGRAEAERREFEAIELRQQGLRTDRSESLDLRGQLPSDTGEITGEQHLANGVIEDHRRATAAAEAATAAAREATAAAEAATASAVQRLADFRDADRHNQSAAEANNLLGEEKQGNGADRQTLSRDCEEALRTNRLRAFFRGFTDRVKGAFKDVIDEVSQLFRPEKGGERLDTHYVAEPSASRAREANQATNREDHQENGLSRAISRQVSGFNTGSIFKALDVIDRRKELELRQRAERSSRLDFDM